MAKIKACLVGISGYAGMELARLLARHPHIELQLACSRAEAGKKLGNFYPFLRGLPGAEVEITAYEPQQAISSCEIAFLAVPAGTAMRMGPDLLQGGLRVIDFSADFRLEDPATYAEWYGNAHSAPELLKTAVYGLPELNAAAIAQTRLVANPGCYPTASILALAAALKHDFVKADTIIIDAKSGASGAGRKAQIPQLFCEVSDNFRAYGVARHRHTPEIEQELSKICHEDIILSFTPHLVPMKRGILATIYAQLKNTSRTLAEIHAAFTEFWRPFPWIRVLPLGELPETAHVRGSMFCDIGLALDPRTGRLIILSAIDNLCRGAAGQALACANLMCGLPIDSGLKNLAPLP